jgi:hypothetical protein
MYVSRVNIKKYIFNHWFLGQTTPFALFVVLASTGNNHNEEFVPNTWTKF